MNPQSAPEVPATLDMSKSDEKMAKLSLRLKADSGFRSTSDYRVSANQWSQIIAVCEDGRQRALMSAAPDLLRLMLRLVEITPHRTLDPSAPFYREMHAAIAKATAKPTGAA